MTKRSTQGAREITVDGESFRFTVGKRITYIWTQHGEQRDVPDTEMFGFSEEDMQSVRENGGRAVTPRMIADYIRDNYSFEAGKFGVCAFCKQPMGALAGAACLQFHLHRKAT